MIVVGLVLACVASGGYGAWKAMARGGVPVAAPVEAQPLVAAPPVTAAEPILAAYFPPDRDQVRRAYDDVAKIYGGEGLSGVVRQSMDCFAGLEVRPSYPDLDYCLAFDAYGAALHQRLLNGAAPDANTFFGASAARDLAAARRVVGKEGDPQARLLDIRRLAGRVSHEDDAPVVVAKAEPKPDLEGAPVEAAPAEEPKLVRVVAEKPVVKKAEIKKVAKAAPSKPKVVKAKAKKPPKSEPKLEKTKLERPTKAKLKVVKTVERERVVPAKAVKTAVKHSAPAKIEKAKVQKTVVKAAAPTLRKPAVTRAAVSRHGPAVDCLRPVGRTERRICAAVDVADDDRRREVRYSADDDAGTLGEQASRLRRGHDRRDSERDGW
jgi:hypothetical protein